MTKNEFLVLLRSNEIDKNLVCFDDNFKDDVLCIRKNHYNWEVVYRERGKDYDLQIFPCESDALEYVYKELLYTHKKYNLKQLK